MPDNSRILIREKIVVPAGRIILAWVLLVVLPIVTSLVALDYFLEEYSHFSESGRLTEAYNDLDLFKEALVVENFLTSRLPNLKALSPKGFKNQDLENLKNEIDSIIGGTSLTCVFFDKNCQKIAARQNRKISLPGVLLPPAPLFRRQLQLLYEKDSVKQPMTPAQSKPADYEKRRIALTMQQLFKSITPITLKKDKASKNFSALFDGELYFLYFEFDNPAEGVPAGCLMVMRGKEFSARFMIEVLKKKHPRCQIIERSFDIVEIEKHPEILNSGMERLENRIVITCPADQRFIRHAVHGGGVKLIDNRARGVPFLQYHLPLESMQHLFAGMRNWFKLLSALLLAVSGLYCLHSCLFGANLSGSFKRRIMITTVLSALFPFSFFSASFYLHLQYDEFLGKINLLQHVNTRLELLNSEFDHYFANLEGNLAIFLQQINTGNFQNKAAIMKLFDEIGAQIPLTRISLQKLDGSFTREFEERSSVELTKDTNDAIENFFPLRTLELLREKQPVERTRQDIIKIPGEELKIALIGKTLISNGSFMNLDQARFPVWLANFKVLDNRSTSNPSVLGLVFSRFETAPLISDFLRKSQFESSNYQEKYGNYLIRYAFFPVERTGSMSIWPGSGHTAVPQIRTAAERLRSENVVVQSPDGTENFVINKLNHGVPHLVVAFAQPIKLGYALKSSMAIGAGSLIFLSLILLLAGKLLDIFFVLPVIKLARSAEQIARGGDSWPLKLSTGDELENLNNSFSSMVKGLQQRNMLRDYVSADAYSDIEASGSQNLAPGGEYREATILFAAIKGFHTLIEGYTPQQTVELLNRFVTLGDNIVKQHGGSIDKILDQTLMLVFRENAGDEESHALRAARTAIKLAEAATADKLPGIFAGIASGTVISGKIGSYQGKLDFTVIGNPVNLAARLKSEAADSSTGIIISGSTMRLLKGKGRVNFLRRCSLKGKAREYNIYELSELR